MARRVSRTSFDVVLGSPRASSLAKTSGFTIVELLIVIVVIAILAAITIVAYNSITGRAHDAAVTATAKEIEDKALANEVLSGQIVAGNLRGFSTGTRAQFLQAQGLPGLVDKVYVTGYIYGDDGTGTYSGVSIDFDKSDPDYAHTSTSGTVTTYSYNTARVYIHIGQELWSYYEDGYQTEKGIALAISLWSSEQGQWVTTVLSRREKTNNYEPRESYSSCSPYWTPCTYDSNVSN